MSMALGIIGMLAFAIGIMMLVVSAIRRRRLRTWGIVIVVGLVAFIIGISLSDSTTQSPESAQSPAPAPTQTPTPESAPTSIPEPAPTLTPEPALVTKDASEMVLTIGDFEPGWVQEKAESIGKEGAQSAYHAFFYEGKSLYPSVVQSTVAVYPSIDLAAQIYFKEIPQNVSLENPKIGDESFLDISVSVQKKLVFRKSNVVVWLWLQRDMFGDVKPYAKIVEKRISISP